MSDLISLYIRDKESGCVRKVGDDQHDMLTITADGELAYLNLQNGDGCRTGGDSGGYEFVPNEDDYGYNIDPRKGESDES